MIFCSKQLTDSHTIHASSGAELANGCNDVIFVIESGWPCFVFLVTGRCLVPLYSFFAICVSICCLFFRRPEGQPSSSYYIFHIIQRSPSCLDRVSRHYFRFCLVLSLSSRVWRERPAATSSSRHILPMFPTSRTILTNYFNPLPQFVGGRERSS